MKNTPYDAILLLGVALGSDDRPTVELRARVKTAAEVWRRYDGTIPVMPCGGVTRGHKRAEAEVMAELLVAEGVPAESIRLENKSRTTVENFRNAQNLLGGNARVLVITSDYHMRRSLKTAKRIGLRARGIKTVMPHDALWICNFMVEVCRMTELKRGWLDYPGAQPKEAKRQMDARYGKYIKRRDELLAELEKQYELAKQ